MASSSKHSAAKANLFGWVGKRNSEHDLETKPVLKKHKETSENKETTEGFADCLQQKSDPTNLISVKEPAVIKRTLFIGNFAPQTTISDIIDFFKDVVQVVRVRLNVTRTWTNKCDGFVEFASHNDAKKALEKKNGEYLHEYKVFLGLPKKNTPKAPAKFWLDHKVWYEDYLRRESLPIEKDETPLHFVEEVLFVGHISPQTKISDIIDFFSYVGEVVSVRLIVNHEGKHVGYGFVEFASANEAKKALDEKNGEYLHDHKIFLEVAKTALYPPGPKYNLAEKLCYEDYLRRQYLLIEKDETVEGLDETPKFVEAVAVREKTLLVDHLSDQTEISDIISFFKDVGEVVHVRLVVDRMGNHVGYGFVEFASYNEAKKALEKKNGEDLHDNKIFLDMSTKAPYPPRPKYCIDHKVWYEDYLRREGLLIEEDEAAEGLDDIPDYVEDVARSKKTIFVTNIPCKTKVRHLIHFFKVIGEIVYVRLIVDHRGENVGCGFVEFASAYEAEEALEKKNGREYTLDVAEMAPYPLRPKYNVAEKLWSKVESILVEEEDEEEEEGKDGEEYEEEYEEYDDDLETQPIFRGKKIVYSFED